MWIQVIIILYCTLVIIYGIYTYYDIFIAKGDYKRAIIYIINQFIEYKENNNNAKN